MIYQSRKQQAVLDALEDWTFTITALASYLHITRGAARNRLYRLENDGLVEREWNWGELLWFKAKR